MMKTFHLIISFPAGEQPEDTILQAIESRICEGLGYGQHQRSLFWKIVLIE